MSITVFSHPYCSMHRVSEVHPEEPARIAAINDQIIRSGMEFALTQKDAKPAEREDLLRVHAANYIDDVFERAPTEPDQHIWLDPDTMMTAGTLRAALYAAGSGMCAVDEVFTAENRRAFCMVRPPGHHATWDAAMGFCIFNNIAVATAYAMHAYGLERVAVVDFDVHHGNGTEDIFLNDERVLFCSSFQHPLYPNSGTETISHEVVNIPLPAGCDGPTWQAVVRERWFPAIDAFAPQLIMVSAGFDGHLEDDMAQFKLTETDYHWIGRELKELAERHCDGRIVATLEGGYEHSSLGRSVVAFLKGMQ